MKSPLKGPEALSCYSSLETSHIRYKKHPEQWGRSGPCPPWGIWACSRGQVLDYLTALALAALGICFSLPRDAPGRWLDAAPCPEQQISQVPLPGLETLLCPQAQVLQQGCSGAGNFSSLQEQAEPFRCDRMRVSAGQEQHKSIFHCLKIYLYVTSKPFPLGSFGRNGVLKCSIIYS